MTYKKGAKKHEQSAVEAMIKEYAQMREKEKRVFIPMKASELTRK